MPVVRFADMFQVLVQAAFPLNLLFPCRVLVKADSRLGFARFPCRTTSPPSVTDGSCARPCTEMVTLRPALMAIIRSRLHHCDFLGGDDRSVYRSTQDKSYGCHTMHPAGTYMVTGLMI